MPQSDFMPLPQMAEFRVVYFILKKSAFFTQQKAAGCDEWYGVFFQKRNVVMKFHRIHDSDFVHFVTNRCEHEMFFMLPKAKINELILFWLAKAKQKKGKDIEIYGFTFLSNHFHMLLKDPRGQISRFMGYFESGLARAINRHIGRKGKFWYREYDDLIVDGEDEFWDRYSYTVLNAVSSGLVSNVAEWKGVCSYNYFKQQKPVVGKSLNLTKYNDATRHGRKVDKSKYIETFSFELAIPPQLLDKTEKQQQRFINELLKAGTNVYAQKREHKPALSMNKVMEQNCFDRPGKPKNRPRKKFMSFCHNRLKELLLMYKQFVRSYQECVHRLLLHCEHVDHSCGVITMDVRFYWPEGCYPPTNHKPIGLV
jgi:REP element-mobilizing transposase RayT